MTFIRWPTKVRFLGTMHSQTIGEIIVLVLTPWQCIIMQNNEERIEYHADQPILGARRFGEEEKCEL